MEGEIDKIIVTEEIITDKEVATDKLTLEIEVQDTIVTSM
jgi:hypothetical protein